MNWPQYTFTCLTCINIGITLVEHGKPKGNHNIFLYLIDCAIVYFLLYKGGFFS